MRPLASVLGVLFLLVVGGLTYVAVTGLSARPQPSAAEVWLARHARSFAIPTEYKNLPDPVAKTEATLAAGMAHFADHCAICHGNDGSGDTLLGRGLYPRPPDMRRTPTQQLSDGTLFYIIERGVRMTGMPAFGDGTSQGELGSWQLVQFIRQLPTLGAADVERMRAFNPRSNEDTRRELEEQQFLEGKDGQ
jgi:mono/diheme cytochrome c family protein